MSALQDKDVSEQTSSCVACRKLAVPRGLYGDPLGPACKGSGGVCWRAAAAAAPAAWGSAGRLYEVLLILHLVGHLLGVWKPLLLFNVVLVWVWSDAGVGKAMLRGAADAVAGQAHVTPLTHGQGQGRRMF